MLRSKSRLLMGISVFLFIVLSACTTQTPIENFTVIFEVNGGLPMESLAGESGSEVILPIPIKEGHTFVGWYDNNQFDGTPKEAVSHHSSGNINMYAKWFINEYSISYFVLTNQTMTHVSLGTSHTSVLTFENQLMIWGYNTYGQIGDGSVYTSRYSPTDITNRFNLNAQEKIVRFSLGDTHSAALTSEGRLFTWGDNWSGQLGDGTNADRHLPTDITGQFTLNQEEKIVHVSLGNAHSSALTSEGRLFTWGSSSWGQLGNGTWSNNGTPTNITDEFNLTTGEKIIDVVIRGVHSSALTSEGRLFTWGGNSFGQLGDGTTSDRIRPTDITHQFNLNIGEIITDISLGQLHSAVLTSEGRMFIWGVNWSGQLGDGTTTDAHTPIDITGRFSLESEEQIIDISLGFEHSSALTSDGRLFTWGDNSSGQLGDGTDISRDIPIDVTDLFDFNPEEKITNVILGGFHSSALTSEGRLYTWGSNTYGALGDNTSEDRITPTMIGISTYDLATADSYDFGSQTIEFIPTREEYIFSGWFIDINVNEQHDFLTMPAQNLVLYGKWIPTT